MLDLFDSTVKVQLERQENLLGISVTINKSNGAYSVGDFKFGITPGCTSWFEQDEENRAKLAEFLRQVAEKVEQEKAQ